MSEFQGTENYAHDAPACLGVLLSNLGTPQAPTRAALRRFLAEFLSDPRVVEAPRWLWWPILHGIILNIRPRKSAHAYQQIWTDDGSPLLVTSRRQVAALQQVLSNRCKGPVRVALGMRYGRPSFADALEELRGAHARRILVLPLYPQYAAATTASTFDAVAAVLRRWRWLPELRMVMSYHEEAGYIGALRESIEAHWTAQGRAERLLFSFHGIPRDYFLAGDPYHCQCHKTARLVAESLRMSDGQWQVVFQSRFGPRQWLQPYTDVTLVELARSGVKSVDVICPGFAADCLETLEEIELRNRGAFLAAGGERFKYIPALNDGPAHIAALADIVCRHIQGWFEADPRRHAGLDAQARQATAARALRAGAPR
ncbi:MAG: ferrochelatase [Chromatiales bacterium]